MTIVEEKACKGCGLNKSLEDFHRDRALQDGRKNKCKSCIKLVTIANRENKVKYDKKYHKDNSAAIAEKSKKRYEANKKEYSIKSKERYKLTFLRVGEVSKVWYEANKDRKQKLSKIWKITNKDKVAGYTAKRRAAKLNAIPSWFGELDELVLSEAYSLAKHREELTGVKWHVDHIVPLQGKLVSGLHCADNIQVITAAENLSKSNKWEA